MLKVKGIETWYGAIQALKGISLEVNQGEIVALLGANGAGKSTTIKTITGLLKPTKGRIDFLDQEITQNSRGHRRDRDRLRPRRSADFSGPDGAGQPQAGGQLAQTRLPGVFFKRGSRGGLYPFPPAQRI